MPPFDGQDDARRVRDAADIVQVVSDHVALKPKGREYVGLCPFHDDRNPSMSVVPAKQIFHCFVCQTGGDVFSFLMKLHGMDFPEALKLLADRFGVPLTPRRPRGEGSAPPSEDHGVTRADIVAANQTAAAFFRAILSHPAHGAAARETIERRGISPDMVETFLLGASPDRWDGLMTTVEGKSLPIDHFSAAGLVKARESGGHYDAFRHRLMFPISDQTGRVVAFGARKLREEDEPKYLNSPEHAAFDKSSTLYGLHQSLKGIKRTNTVIVTEGYTDVVACHQHGFDYAVAALGTAFTERHAQMLGRLLDVGGRIVLLFDSDEAGQRAADRATRILFSQPNDVRVATFGREVPAKDPDELLKSPNGGEVFQRVIENARELLAFRFDRLRARMAPMDRMGRAALVEQEIRELAELGIRRLSPIRKKVVLDQLAELSGLDQGQIAGLITATRVREPRGEPSGSSAASSGPPSPISSPAQHALGCVLAEPGLHASLERADLPMIGPDAYRSAAEAAVARAVDDIVRDGAQPGLSEVLVRVQDPEVTSAAVRLQAHVSQITESKPERLSLLFEDCVRQLRRSVVSDEEPAEVSVSELEARIAAQKARGPDTRRLPKPS
ncbi:MAG: DNA primase [Planctomycetota bacterium]